MNWIARLLPLILALPRVTLVDDNHFGPLNEINTDDVTRLKLVSSDYLPLASIGELALLGLTTLCCFA